MVIMTSTVLGEQRRKMVGRREGEKRRWRKAEKGRDLC